MQQEMDNNEQTTREALLKIEQLVKLNDRLMQENKTLKQQAQDNLNNYQSAEAQIQTLQQDMMVIKGAIDADHAKKAAK